MGCQKAFKNSAISASCINAPKSASTSSKSNSQNTPLTRTTRLKKNRIRKTGKSLLTDIRPKHLECAHIVGNHYGTSENCLDAPQLSCPFGRINEDRHASRNEDVKDIANTGSGSNKQGVSGHRRRARISRNFTNFTPDSPTVTCLVPVKECSA